MPNKIQSAHSLEKVVVIEVEKLLGSCLGYLRAECAQAHAAKEPVLLLMFGYGDQDTHGVAIGRYVSGETLMLSIKIEKDILQEFPGLHLFAPFTSCYSGGWTTYVNMTLMTVAGQREPSESWSESHSLGRTTDSIFATAIVERLLNKDIKTDPRPIDTTSYRLFSDEVKGNIAIAG